MRSAIVEFNIVRLIAVASFIPAAFKLDSVSDSKSEILSFNISAYILSSLRCSAQVNKSSGMQVNATSNSSSVMDLELLRNLDASSD